MNEINQIKNYINSIDMTKEDPLEFLSRYGVITNIAHDYLVKKIISQLEVEHHIKRMGNNIGVLYEREILDQIIDGNGRTSRALLDIMLKNRGIVPPVLYDTYFDRKELDKVSSKYLLEEDKSPLQDFIKRKITETPGNYSICKELKLEKNTPTIVNNPEKIDEEVEK